MFLFVMGLPGRFADWCDAVVAQLAARAFGCDEIIRADTLEDVALGAMRSAASPAVIAARQPGGALRRALVEAGRPFVVALDDPRTALIDLTLRDGIPLPDAVQAIASSCAALDGYVVAPGALVLHGDRDRARPETTAQRMAQHFGLTLDEAAIAAALSDAASDTAAASHDAVAWWTGLDAVERATATGALAPFIHRQAADEPLSITWNHPLFYRGNRPQERAIGPIDITGRPHCVIEGPRIMLPPGAWSLSLNVLFSRHAAEREFSVEVCTDRPIASGTIQPTQGGGAGVDLEFTLDDTTEHPLAIRVSSLRAIFDGTITVGGATLVRTIGPTVDRT